MTQFTITITPHLENGEHDARAQTSMRVVTDKGTTHIRELTVTVSEAGAAVPTDVMQTVLGTLLQALTHAQPAAKADKQPAKDTPRVPSRRKTDRPYRRMPDPEELRKTYLKSRTVVGVAEHYDVPTHTAQGWIGRLRKKGVIPENA